MKRCTKPARLAQFSPGSIYYFSIPWLQDLPKHVCDKFPNSSYLAGRKLIIVMATQILTYQGRLKDAQRVRIRGYHNDILTRVLRFQLAEQLSDPHKHVLRRIIRGTVLARNRAPIRIAHIILRHNASHKVFSAPVKPANPARIEECELRDEVLAPNSEPARKDFGGLKGRYGHGWPEPGVRGQTELRERVGGLDGLAHPVRGERMHLEGKLVHRVGVDDMVRIGVGFRRPH